MSETAVTAEVEQDNEPAELIPNAGPIRGLVLSLREDLVSAINEHNDSANKLKQLGGDEQALLEDMRESSTDPQVVSLRSDIEKLQAALFAAETQRDEVIKQAIAALRENKIDDITALNEVVKTKRSMVDNGVKFLTDYLAQVGYTVEDLHLPTLVSKRSARSSNASTSGETQTRVRGFDLFVDGVRATLKANGGKIVSNMSAAAKVIGVTTQIVQAGFFEAAGGKQENTDNYPDRVTFNITNGDKTYRVDAVRPNKSQAPAVAEATE